MKKHLKLTIILPVILIVTVLCAFVTYATDADEGVTEYSDHAVVLENGYVYDPPLPPSGVESAFAEFVYHTHENGPQPENCIFCLLHDILVMQQFGENATCPFCDNGTMHPLTDYDNFFPMYVYLSQRDTACYMLKQIDVLSSTPIDLSMDFASDGKPIEPARGFDSPIIWDMCGNTMTFRKDGNNQNQECMISFNSDFDAVVRNGILFSYTDYTTSIYENGVQSFYYAANSCAPIFGLNSPGVKLTFENVFSASAGLVTSFAADGEKCPEVNIIGGKHYVIYEAFNPDCTVSALVQSSNNVVCNVKDSVIVIDEDGALMSSQSYGKYDATYESKSSYTFDGCTIIGSYSNINLIPYTNNRTNVLFVNSRLYGSITPELSANDAEYFDPYTNANDLALPTVGDRMIEIGRFTSYATKGTAAEFNDYYEIITFHVFDGKDYAFDRDNLIPRRSYDRVTEDVPTVFSDAVTIYGDIYDIDDSFKITQRLSDPSYLVGGHEGNLEYCYIYNYSSNGDDTDVDTKTVYFGMDVTNSATFDKKVVNVKVIAHDATMTDSQATYHLPDTVITAPQVDTETVHSTGFFNYQYTGRWLDKNGDVFSFEGLVATYEKPRWEVDEASLIEVYPEATITPYLSAAGYNLTLTTDLLLNVIIPTDENGYAKILSVTANDKTLTPNKFIDFDGKTKYSYTVASPGNVELMTEYEAYVEMEISMPGLNAGRSVIIEQKISHISALRYILVVLADSQNVEAGTNLYDPIVHTMMADLLRYSESVISLSENATHTPVQTAIYDLFKHLCTPISDDIDARITEYGKTSTIDALADYVNYVTFVANYTSLKPIIKFKYDAKVTNVDFTLKEGWVHGRFSTKGETWGESRFAADTENVIYWSMDGSFLAKKIDGAWYEVNEAGEMLSNEAIDESLVSHYIALVSPDGLQIYNIEKMLTISITTENGDTAEGTYSLAAYYSAKLAEYNDEQLNEETMTLIRELVLNACALGTSSSSFRFGTAIDANGAQASSLW